MTGDKSMQWVGTDPLPTKTVRMPNYVAAPLLPNLDARTAARAFDRAPRQAIRNPEVDPGERETLTGPGWTVTVKQSPFSTIVRYDDSCQTATANADEAIKQAQKSMRTLGGVPDEWSWFTIGDANGGTRVVAEPTLDGRPTWSTGLYSALVDDDGVCAVNANLIRFKAAGGYTTLPSAHEVFHEARQTPGRPIAGRYAHAEPSWTIESEGRLVPLWHFTSTKHGIVAVDLGDGLETTLDTYSMLTSLANAEE